MTTESADVIHILVQHFILGEEKPRKDIGDALIYLSTTQPFEALGRAVLMAALKLNVAKLQADRATLVAKLPAKGPLH